MAAAGWLAAGSPASANAPHKPRGKVASAAPPAKLVRDQDLCQAAIQSLLPTADLPKPLLDAIGRVETGRVDPADGKVKPWPWTINAEGQGTMFDRRDQAIAAVMALQARGVSSIDVGCMQVNLAYHPQAFATLDDAFDPQRNVRAAAHFLGTLFTQIGDWEKAAAAYHSKTPDIAEPYRIRVMAALGASPQSKAVPPRRPAGPSPLQLAWSATISPVANRF